MEITRLVGTVTELRDALLAKEMVRQYRFPTFIVRKDEMR